MEAIQVMMSEHARIVGVLDALDAFAGAACDTAADRLELGRFLQFFREYADGCHHGKEEHVLFLAMFRHGFSLEEGPLGMMVFEHQDLRDLLGRVRDLVRQEAPWSGEEREQLAATIRTYTGVLREHIVKEDELLYPLAREQLPPAVREQVDRECASLDAGRNAAVAPPLLLLAADLVARHGRAIVAV